MVLIGVSLTVAGIDHPRFIFQLYISFSEMSIHVFSLFSSWSVVFFFPWLLLFLSFSANHQAGLASWAALLKGSYPPKREKPEVSENTHPPCSFLSFSISLPSVR